MAGMPAQTAQQPPTLPAIITSFVSFTLLSFLVSAGWWLVVELHVTI